MLFMQDQCSSYGIAGLGDFSRGTTIHCLKVTAEHRTLFSQRPGKQCHSSSLTMVNKYLWANAEESSGENELCVKLANYAGIKKCTCVLHLFNMLLELDAIPLYHFLENLLGLKIALSPQECEWNSETGADIITLEETKGTVTSQNVGTQRETWEIKKDKH